MKKLSMFFTALAMSIAVIGAFAFDQSVRTESPAWIDTSGNQPICEPALVVCGGGSQLCEKEVNGNIEAIYEFDTTADCKFSLYME